MNKDVSIKDYMEDQQTERVAYIVMKNFEKLTGRPLTKDEREFTITIAKSTFDKYVVEHKDDIYVAGTESQERLKGLLDQFTDSLSTLMVHYIYSRLEAYILYKQVKLLKE